MHRLHLHALSALLLVIHQSIALRCPDISVRYGRVKYRSRGRVAIFGCWAAFTLYGEKYAGCFRGIWDVTPPKCVRKGCNELSLRFGTIKKPLYNTAVIGFRCFPGYDLVGPKEIYCNGTSYDNLPPVCKREETDMACDFENQGLCKWRNDPTANLTFNLRQQATPSRILNTGPDHDHTLDPEVDGYYLYLESSSTIQGETARIISPYLPHANDDNTCFKFWYHMYGSTIGALRVYINETKIFEKEGNRGDRWRLGKVKLPSASHFKIVVEAVTGRGYSGDIAIDDLDMGDCTDDTGSTCLDRCFEDESDEFANCDCHPGCIDELSCCVDYRHYCVADTTTEIAEYSTAHGESSSENYLASSTLLDDKTDEINVPNLVVTDSTNGGVFTEPGNVAFDDYHEANSVTDELLDMTTPSNISEITVDLITIADGQNTNEYDDGTPVSIIAEDTTVIIPLHSHDSIPNVTQTTRKLTSTKSSYTIDRSTKRYNLRPRTTRVSTTVLKTSKTTSLPGKISITERTKSSSSIHALDNSNDTVNTPVVKHSTIMTPVRSTTTKKLTPPTTVTTTRHSVAKDPKITTRFQSNISPTIIVKIEATPTDVPVLTEITVINDSKHRNNSSDKMTELPTYQASESPDNRLKWKSKYKSKGLFEPMVITQENSSVTMASIFTVSIFFFVTIAAAVIVIIILRRRRLSSRVSDGAEILFIASDEILDFTQASGGHKRDSGVYSETVMSLKRENS